MPANDGYDGTRCADLSVAGAAEHLSALRAAVAGRRQASDCATAPAARRRARTRTIDPHSLVFAEQMWYLVASADDDALRFFRVDRVEESQLLDERFERDASAGLRVQEAGRAFASEHGSA